MDEYGQTYVEICKPLVLLSGLGDTDETATTKSVLQRNGLRLDGSSPIVPPALSKRLLDEFQRFSDHGHGSSSNEKGVVEEQPLSFKTCGRTYNFPNRKAVPQASPADIAAQEVMSPGGTTLHSPLSPLSPGSPLFPDGVMTPLWMEKHRAMIPAVFLAFYVLSTDENMQSLHDNQLKQEIGAIKLRLDESSYKTRFGIVLLSENSILDDQDLEDRLNNIKRTTKLDSKSGFFYIQTSVSQGDLASFIQPIVSALRGPVIEYYRDLTRHARRKRDRGSSNSPSAPTTPGISRSLSRSSWNARYEYKLGVFADFRQEYDIAARHYNASLDHLFHPDGFFETVTNWSPRWNETRKFADVVALRFIRCQLQNELPSSAVMFWKHYRSRSSSVLNRKGKGTSDYGWRAWEARWSIIMAELMVQQDSASASPSVNKAAAGLGSHAMIGGVYQPAEKQIQSDDPLHPWDNLHHPGYWYKLAVAFTKARRWLAAKIPPEDRLPPGQSPAAAVARRSEKYDTYMCPDPPEEYEKVETGGGIHDEIIKKLLAEAIKYFSQHDQARMAAFLRLSLGKQLLSTDQLEDAHEILKRTWQENPWRQAQWWELVRDSAMSLHMSSLTNKDLKMQIASLWELSHRNFRPADGLDYSLETLLQNAPDDEQTVSLDFAAKDSFISVTCLFEKTQGHAGEPISLRIIVMNSAHQRAPAVAPKGIQLEFEGGMKICVEHNDNSEAVASAPENSKTSFEDIKLSGSGSVLALWSGQASLLLAPGQTKVFIAEIVVREAGRLSLRSTLTKVQYKKVKVDIVSTDLRTDRTQPLSEFKRLLPGIRTPRSEPQQIEVLPKPPKLELRANNLEKVYYTDEKARFELEIVNREAVSANVTIQIRLLGNPTKGLSLQWTDATTPEHANDAEPLKWSAGTIAQSASLQRGVTLQAPASATDVSFEIRADYHLESDPDTPVLKVSTMDAIVVHPFEASYSVAPRWQPDIWPDFFSIPQPALDSGTSDENPTNKQAVGIATRWSITASLTSTASSDLIVSNATLVASGVSAGGRARIIPGADSTHEQDQKQAKTIAPKSQFSRSFVLDLQKADLDERRTISTSAELDISWRRAEADATELIHTVLEIPRMSFPSGEPRVLAMLQQPGESGEDDAILIDFVLENPSMHFLSFGITMELSEDYAFSGPKATTLNLLPMSRRTLKCAFAPLKRGVWIQPKLSIVDLYFDRRLEIQATEGLKADSEGLWVWVEGEARPA